MAVAKTVHEKCQNCFDLGGPHILTFVRQQSDSKLLHTRTKYLFQLYSLNKVSDYEFWQQGIMQTEMKSSFFISSN